MLNYTRYEKIVMIQNYLLHKDLQILSDAVSDKMYIFRFNSKKYD